MTNLLKSLLPKDSLEKKVIIFILFFQFIQSLWAIYNYGYIGQDFETHMAYAEDYFRVWNFHGPNAPMFYWLPRFLRSFVSLYHFNEILAFFFLILNSLSLIFIYPFLKSLIYSKTLRIACLLIIAFAPFRLIHSIVYAGDALMMLPFFIIAYCALKVFQNNTFISKKKYWLLICITLFISIGQKYNIISLLPPLFLVFLIDFYKSSRTIYSKKLLIYASLAFLLPTAFFGFHWIKSKKAGSYTTTTPWKAPTEPSKMNWNDILFLKKADRELFRAPQYFKELSILENHKHSYPALLWMASFTDTMNFWQGVPHTISRSYGERRQRGFPKIKSDSVQKWSQISLKAVLPLLSVCFIAIFVSLIKIIRTSFQFLKTKNLINNSESLLIILSFSLCFHLFMIINLPKLAEPYQFGYWLPRYIVPALMGYFILGFSFLDSLINKIKIQKLAHLALLIYSLILSGIFIYIL